MIDVLISHPLFGRLWLNNAEWHGDSVEGEVWDDSEVGSPYLPDDFGGQPTWMSFPISCVQKVTLHRQVA